MTKLYNRARVTITSTGTGTLSLGSAVSGYQTFASSGAQNGDVVSYVIEDGLNWEVGTGTFNSAANTLTRTVTQSYNGSTYGTSAISVTTAAQVFISPLAADLQDGTSANQLVRLDGSAKLPAVDGSNLTNVKTPPGGTTGQVQYNAGSNTFGGFTVSGDGTLNTSTGALTVTKTNGTSFSTLATTTPGTGVATAVTVNVGTAGAVIVNGGALGTPSSGTLTNCTGLPASTGVTGLAASATTDTTNASNISSGTLALARGGTASSLSNPGADRIMFWRNSTTAVDWLAPAAGVDISGTTFNGNKTPTTQVFTSTGTSTWTKPSGCRTVIVEVAAGGGGGGGIDGQGASNYGFAGGGGAGGYARLRIDVTSVSTVTVTVGSGGAGGAAGNNNGSTGGSSSFGAYCSATGGSGGNGRVASTSFAAATGGSAGVGSSGDVNGGGGPGSPGIWSTDGISGAGGSLSPYGSGARGINPNNGTTLAGANATGYGSGGSGAASLGNTADAAGGNGSQGIVIVREFY